MPLTYNNRGSNSNYEVQPIVNVTSYPVLLFALSFLILALSSRLGVLFRNGGELRKTGA